MARYNAAYEIHVHGLVPLQPEVGLEQLQDALRPLWQYAGASSLEDGASSSYPEEPGIRFNLLVLSIKYPSATHQFKKHLIFVSLSFTVLSSYRDSKRVRYLSHCSLLILLKGQYSIKP